MTISADSLRLLELVVTLSQHLISRIVGATMRYSALTINKMNKAAGVHAAMYVDTTKLGAVVVDPVLDITAIITTTTTTTTHVVILFLCHIATVNRHNSGRSLDRHRHI